MQKRSDQQNARKAVAIGRLHRSGIDPLFFDHYKDELDSINARNAALAGDVATYVADRCRGDVPDQQETVFFRDLRELRDRLYTFVACGVNSSVSTDAERFDILRKLGFGVAHPSDPINITPLLWSSLFALVVLSVFTGSSVYLFEKWVLTPLPEGWKQAFPVPKLPFEIYAWTWSTAAFYFLTIIGALAVRNTRVARRKWFDLNNLDRDRPYLKYMNPIILGTLFGCVMLSVIALLGGPAFQEASISLLPQLGKSVGEAVRKTLPWYPLAIVMATIAVTLSDTQLTDDRRWLRRSLVNAATGAAIMTVVGFLCAYIVITASIAAYASKINQATNDIPKSVAVAGTYLDLFIALQIGLIAFILCWFIQVFERYRTRVRCFAGKRLTIATRHGPTSVMTFDASGKAALVPMPTDEPGRPQQIREGRWQHFPEGTAVKWTAGGAEVGAGRFGLISGLGGSLIYEGYADHFIGEPELIAQVQVSG